MRKLLFIIAFASCTLSYAQETATTDSGKTVILNKNGTYKYLKKTPVNEKTRLTEKDFQIIDGRYTIFSKKINVQIYSDKLQECTLKFIADEEHFNRSGIDVINSIIFKANLETMHDLKNQATYLPNNFFITFSKDRDMWLVAIDYTAQNDYGGTKNGTAKCLVTTDGIVYDINY